MRSFDLRLGDIVRLQRGNTYKSALLGLPGPVLLGLGTIKRNGGFRVDSLRTYGGESDERMLLKPGDLFVSLKDVTQAADLLGAVARVPNEVPVGRLTQDTVKLEFYNKSIPRDYVYWLLQTPQYRSFCKSRATGTTNLGLAREDFLGLPIPVPGDRELKVCSVLENIESKIELNRQMNETQERVIRAIFKSWFIDFDPVHAKRQDKMPFGMDDATKALFPDSLEQSAHGEIPKGWTKGLVSDLFDANTWTLSKGDQLDRIDYIEISGVSSGQVNEIATYQSGEEPSRARRRLRHLDTVLSTVRPDRAAYFLAYQPSDTLVASTGFAVLTPKNLDESLFGHICITMKDFFDELGRLADGGAYPAIRPEIILSRPIVLPPRSLREAFHRLVEPMIAIIKENQAESATLSACRDLLLPRLLSGELTMKEDTP